jgi:hypothetical protein
MLQLDTLQGPIGTIFRGQFWDSAHHVALSDGIEKAIPETRNASWLEKPCDRQRLAKRQTVFVVFDFHAT